MEDYYGDLNCAPSDTQEQIKHKYQQLVLRLHPDKLQQQGVNNPYDTEDDGLSRYHQVQKAWKVLSDPDMRREYDARWNQRNVAQQWSVQEVVNLDEFDCDNDETDHESYSYGCRCGGQYILTGADVSFCVDYVCCSVCSLCIKVTYQTEQVKET